jgi:hypothetical protein
VLISRVEILLNYFEFLLGVAAGIATNFFVWWVLFHWLDPDIQFSPQLSKVPRARTELDKAQFRYRVKLENSGRRRAIDIEIMARLRVKGLKTPQIWNILYVPLRSNGDVSHRIPFMDPAKTGVVANRKIIFLHLNSSDTLPHWSIFPEEIRQRAENRELLLEELLSIGSKADLQFYAYAYDSFSGTRKLFVSKRYTAEDIAEGPFAQDGLNVNDVISSSDSYSDDLDNDDH